MADRIQLRRDLAAVWTMANPILGQGEPGVEIDTNRVKIGNGILEWNNLPYIIDASLSYGYTHNQLATASVWTITHGMGKFPSVTVVDSGGSMVVGQVEYLDSNSLTVTFTAPFGGKAYLN